MRIWLRPDVMAQYGLMPTDIVQALNEQNIGGLPLVSWAAKGSKLFEYALTTRGRLKMLMSLKHCATCR